MVQSVGAETRLWGFQFQLLISCVALGRLLNLSGPQVPYLEREANCLPPTAGELETVPGAVLVLNNNNNSKCSIKESLPLLSLLGPDSRLWSCISSLWVG